MKFSEQIKKLSEEDLRKLTSNLQHLEINIDDIDALFSLKIVLEGTNFHGTVPADMAHSLWKLQLAYYRMVGQILYGSPCATLSAEEKETYKLVFKIEKGSTSGIANIDPSFFELASKAFDKMEPWQILLGSAMLCSVYLGAKWFEHLTESKKIAADLSKSESDNEVTKKMLDTHKEIFISAQEAGRDGRLSIIKGVSGISNAHIGLREYDGARIEQIRRRASRVKATSETVHLCIAVDELDAHDKTNPVVVVKPKGGDQGFKASLDLNPDDYSDYDKVLDIVWDSARFPDRYFWAEVTFTKRRDKIITASISSVALEEQDLPQTTDDSSE